MVSTGPCSATDSVTIQADSLPAASISADTTDGCTPLTVVFTNTSAGAVSYQWDFADGGSFSGIDTSHLFINNGTSDTVYLVRMVATTSAGCTDTAFLPITVHPIPLVAFTSNAAPGCSPLQVSFTDASIGVSQYYWDFGDGSIDTVNASPNHAFYNTGVFILVDTVELIGVSAFGCSDSISSLVTIYPSANSVIAVPDTGCSPMTVQFSSTLIGAVLFDWDFGDGSVDSVQSPIHTFVNPSATDTNYTVTLIVTSGFLCVDTSYANILVYAKPTSIFSADTAQGCGPLTINFTNSSIGGVSYQWDFGDGNTLDTSVTTFPYAYTNVGGAVDSNLASLEVTSSNGCMDTMSIPIQVFSSVFASFSQSDTAGCSPLSVSFTDGSTFADLYSWDFGDNSSLDSTSDPGHVFSNSGTVDSTYDVRLIILSNNGCLDSAFAQVLIYPSPTAAFAVTPMSQMFPNATVNVANLSSPGTWNYAWDFGDGAVDSTVGPAAHSYSTWNDYTIELIVYSDECSDTTETIVTVVQPPPISGFALDTNAGCRPVIVTFKDTSLYADSLMWDFGDGTPFYFTSDTQAISHTYYDAGIYVVTLRAFGVGGTFDIGATTVEVYEIPVASFAINPNPAIIYLPDKPIYCVNLSSNATNYQWTFGDGVSSTEESPAHYYTEVGDYDIVLIASNLFGCYDTLIVPAAVAVEEGGEILFPTAFTPNPAGPGDGIYDPNNFNNDIFHPYWDGVDQYLLRIFNRWGELLFETEDIDQGWDGYYRGELVQQDVYVWKANVLFENGEQKTMAGDVTLLR